MACPLNIAKGYDEAAGGTPVAPTPRPNYVSEWYNPLCFNLEAPGTMGNTGRDTVRGPGFVDADIGIMKDTRIRETVSLQFRAEFFNIFNHTNLGLPTGGLGGASLFLGGGQRNGSAGQITSMVGTPRQIQFALKILF